MGKVRPDALTPALSHGERENIVSQFLRFNFSFLDTYPDNYYRDGVLREGFP